jgi:surfactin synthase thioesterase subunit
VSPPEGQFDPSLVPLNPGSTSSRALVCVPHAGAGVSVFRRWDSLGGSASVWVVRLPGREKRILDRPLTSIHAMADSLTGPVQRLGAEDIVFFGHCSGALVAYELARRLEGKYGETVKRLRLIVSSQPAPSRRPVISRPAAQLPRRELLRRLRDAGGTPDEVLASDEIMAFLEPAIRADLAAAESYAGEPGSGRLAIEILAIAADGDPHLPYAALQEWREFTTGPFSAKVLDGAHFFSGGREETILRFIAE